MDQLRARCEELGVTPRVWLRVPGYVVRNYSPDLEESVLHHMITYYIKEAPFCRASKLSEDPKSVEDMRVFWGKTIKSNLTLICLPEGSPGADLRPVTGVVRLAGLNILRPVFKDEPPSNQQFLGVNAKRALRPINFINNMINFFARFNVGVFMDASGLSVHPDERGQGLSAAILNARSELCRDLGIKVSRTVFTSLPAQIVALKCGFEALIEIPYDDFKDEDGQPYLPNLPTKAKAILTAKTVEIKN